MNSFCSPGSLSVCLTRFVPSNGENGNNNNLEKKEAWETQASDRLGYRELITTTAATATATTVSTAATTTAAAVITTTAAAAAARRTVFAWASNVDVQGTAIDVSAIQRFDCLLRFGRAAHGNETESARAAAHAVHHQIGFNDSAVRGKHVIQFVFSGIEGKISNKQFTIAHYVMSFDKLYSL
jgi:hypothetical protein